MEKKENLSVWRNICKIGAYVDLASQILGVIVMIVIWVYHRSAMLEELAYETNMLGKILITILVVVQILQIYLVVLAVRMIKGCSKERAVEDALNTATLWRAGQLCCLFLAVSFIVRGFWEAGILSALIRLTMICIGTKFIGELKKRTVNTCEGLQEFKLEVGQKQFIDNRLVPKFAKLIILT